MKIQRSLFLILIFLISSCDDIFVKDISNEEIVIICPKDGFSTTSTNEILFWWESLDAAESYDLQIVTPNFSNVTLINLDVSVDTNKYSITLPVGNYQWRIRANNSSYSTQYITRSISVVDKK